jgi:3-keto steroid reductase
VALSRYSGKLKGCQAKLLLDKLYASPLAEPRLIWTGSLDGLPQYYDPEDPQAVDSGCSYQSTKFECALLAWAFNDLLKEREQAQQRVRVRSFVVHPGVVAGNMFRDIRASALPLKLLLTVPQSDPC